MGWKKSAPYGASDLAKMRAAFLHKAERLLHGAKIAKNLENSDKWYQGDPGEHHSPKFRSFGGRHEKFYRERSPKPDRLSYQAFSFSGVFDFQQIVCLRVQPWSTNQGEHCRCGFPKTAQGWLHDFSNFSTLLNNPFATSSLSLSTSQSCSHGLSSGLYGGRGIIPSLNYNRSFSAPQGQATRSPWQRHGFGPF